MTWFIIKKAFRDLWDDLKKISSEESQGSAMERKPSLSYCASDMMHLYPPGSDESRMPYVTPEMAEEFKRVVVSIFLAFLRFFRTILSLIW